MSDHNDKKYVLVETIQQYRIRYVVELNSGDPMEWALDDVVSQETVELSQQDLGETIVSHRVLNGGLQEALEMARQDNKEVTNQWPDDLVYKNHITPLSSR